MAPALDLVDRILEDLIRTEGPPGRPSVTLSYAQSLDGSVAVVRGLPLAISGVESRRMSHRLRAAHDAILVGIGTILADDPQLTVREVSGKNPQPIVLDSHLRFPSGARLLQSGQPWIATTPPVDVRRAASLEERGARVMVFPADSAGKVSLPALLECLYQVGVKRLMVEGGAEVITSFLAGCLVDYLVLTIAPALVGGQPAIVNLLAEGDGERLDDHPTLREFNTLRMGRDLIVWGQMVS
jgi:3,4-dihydroxy 2-butanone 4-phosphate synthase/GTP cyclohydrolase II